MTSRQRARSPNAFETYQVPAGSANANASTGRIVAAHPSASPFRNANPGAGPDDAIARAIVAIATMSHISVGTWFMWDPDMKTANGAIANNTAAPTAISRCGSTTRTYDQNAATASAPQMGPTSHGAPTSTPNASIAG